MKLDWETRQTLPAGALLFSILLALLLWSHSMATAGPISRRIIDDFESGALRWKAAAQSSVRNTAEAAKTGKSGLEWTLHSNGVERYGNEITLPVSGEDWSQFDTLSVDFYTAQPITGRIGCQIMSEGKETTLADVSTRATMGKWTTVRLLLPESGLKSVTSVRFFCDALGFAKGEHVFYMDNLTLQAGANGPAVPTGQKLPGFGALSAASQLTIRHAVAPPPLAARRNPYSVPMYYPQWGGGTPDGKLHPEWQEALIKDWADLGCSKLHLYLYANGTGTDKRDYAVDEQTRLGLREFVRLCRKYGVRIGLRVDLPYSMRDPKELPKGSDPIADFWPAHPDNPQNELKPYFGWLTEILGLLKGNCEYLILGDEMNFDKREGGKGWNPEIYMRVFKQTADIVHRVDPKIKASMYSTESGRWNEVKRMITEAGYTNYGDAVAINHYDYKAISAFMQELKVLSPNKELPLLSNGVGYISSDTKDRNPPQDAYSKYNDTDQASMIARTMYTWWALGADVAPYYVCMRNVVYHGKKMPQWYGFFGFMDLVIDDQDNAAIGHYPGWYAYRTVAQVFHDRPAFKDAGFPVEADNTRASYVRAYERDGKELLIMLWSEEAAHGTTNLRIRSDAYGYPVQISGMNPDKWTDIISTKEKPGEAGITLWNVPVGTAPTIIRLVRPTLATPGREAKNQQEGKNVSASEKSPTYVVEHTTQPPVIDGRLDDAVWKHVAPSAAFRNNRDGEAAADKTTVKLAWDSHALYVAFECACSHAPKAAMTAHDSPIWNEENVELLFDAPGKQRAEDKVELLVNPLGTRADLRWLTPDLQTSLQWNAPGVKVATHVSGTGAQQKWVAEYAIPFHAIPNAPAAPPKPGDEWRVGIYRKIVQGDNAIYQAWSPTFDPSFHKPERFGTLRFEAAQSVAKEAANAH